MPAAKRSASGCPSKFDRTPCAQPKRVERPPIRMNASMSIRLAAIGRHQVITKIARSFVGRLDRDDDRFRRRRLAFFGNTAERDKRIGFRKICRGTVLRDRIRHDDKSISVPFAVVKMAGEIDDLAGLAGSSFSNIVGIQKETRRSPSIPR